MAQPRRTSVRIDLTRPLELLQTHITASLCQTVFDTVRATERQRRWTLEALVRFWLAVVIRAPRALSHALAETLPAGTDPLFPQVAATPEAFFERCRDLRPAFFRAVFTEFTARLRQAAPARYRADLAALQGRFAAVCVVDGSSLPAIAHRLKLLWAERAVVPDPYGNVVAHVEMQPHVLAEGPAGDQHDAPLHLVSIEPPAFPAPSDVQGRIGVRYLLTDDLMLDGAVGRSLTPHGEVRFYATAGLTWTFDAPWRVRAAQTSAR